MGQRCRNKALVADGVLVLLHHVRKWPLCRLVRASVRASETNGADRSANSSHRDPCSLQ